MLKNYNMTLQQMNLRRQKKNKSPPPEIIF